MDSHAGSSRPVEFRLLLFAYGTLLLPDHFPMARYLSEVSTPMGQARLRGRLYDLGAYPGAAAAADGTEWVQGRLFRVAGPEVLEVLDQYEGINGNDPSDTWEYRREWLPVLNEEGTWQEAWVYCYNWPVEESRLIPKGNYLEYWEKERKA